MAQALQKRINYEEMEVPGGEGGHRKDHSQHSPSKLTAVFVLWVSGPVSGCVTDLKYKKIVVWWMYLHYPAIFFALCDGFVSDTSNQKLLVGLPGVMVYRDFLGAN